MTLGGSTAVSTFDEANEALPTVASVPDSGVLASDSFSMDANGRLSPITFANSNLELEGFFIPGRGLLLRVIDTPSQVSSGASTLADGDTYSFVCGPASDYDFVDPYTDAPAAGDDDSLTFMCGFVLAGAAITSESLSSVARADAGVVQAFSALGTVEDFDNMAQGVLFGIAE